MNYHTYFDLKIHEDPEIPSWDLIGRVWRIVHVAGGSTHTPFAISFPNAMNKGFGLGQVMRVFTTSQEHAEKMYDSIEAYQGIGDLVEKSRIRRIDNVSRYECYVMQRLSGKKDNFVDVEARRLRQLAQQQHLPFIRMRTSKGNLFKLVFDRLEFDASQLEGLSLGEPNGYGLSRRTSLVLLPIIKS